MAQSVKTFLELVGTGQRTEVLRILSVTPDIVNAIGPHPFWGGRPQALHVAIETGRRDIFGILLDAGADVNGSNGEYDHWSPLMLAIQRDRKEMRDELIRRGARIGLPEALLLGDDKRVEELLRPGESALPSNGPNDRPWLSFARTPFAIDRLVALGVPVDWKDRWGSTPVQSLSRLGRKGAALVQHLASHGARVSPADYARLGDRRALASLIKADPLVAGQEDVIFAAVDSGLIALTRWLLAQSASVNARTGPPSRHTLLHAAAWNGNLTIVKLLVESGADTTARDEEHNGTPKDWADAAITIRNDPKCRKVAQYLTEPRAPVSEPRR